MDWEPSPPDLDPEEPCCDPIGAPVDIPVDDVGFADLEWNGNGWGLLHTSNELVSMFQELDADGSPVGRAQRYSVAAAGARLTWGAGRFAAFVMSEGSGPQDTVLALLDRRGIVDAGWTDLSAYLPDRGPRIARVEHLDRWLVVGTQGGSVDALEVDARASVVGAIRFGVDATERPEVVGMKGRGVAFWRSGSPGGEVFARVLTVPLTEVETETIRVARVDLGTFASTRLRDRAVVAGTLPGRRGWIGLVDPFDGEVSEHEFPLEGEGGLIQDMAGLDTVDLLAMCTLTPSPNYLDLQLLTPDGEVLGAPVHVTDDGGHNCALGIRGDTIFVAWQRAFDRHVRVQAFSLRRRE